MPSRKSKPQIASQKPTHIVWSPQRGPQTAFLASPVFELLYGGAAGGGKSEGLIYFAIALCQQHPHYKAILFRRTFPEIERSLVPRVAAVLSGYAHQRAQGFEWKFPNGSVLYLSHLQQEQDKEKHKSSEYDFIGFDELTSFTETQYTYLFSRCRGATDVPRYIRSATNPTGIGHSWVKRRFVTPDPAEQTPVLAYPYEAAYGWELNGQVYTSFNDLPTDFYNGHTAFKPSKYIVYEDIKAKSQRCFIPALLWGNEKLLKADPTYVQRIRNMDVKSQLALLEGLWTVFEGQFFEEWDEKIHTSPPVPIPHTWKRFVAIDYGFASPMCALWFALAPDQTIHVYRELYGTKMTTDEQAEYVSDMTPEDERIEWYTADPALFQRQGTGESHADIYSRHGIDLIPSSNKRIPGWALVHEYLKNKKLIVHTTCPNTIRTFPTLNHSKTRPEDLDTQQEDHPQDVIRYFLLTLKGYSTNISSKDPALSDLPPPPDWFKKAQKRYTERMRQLTHSQKRLHV